MIERIFVVFSCVYVFVVAPSFLFFGVVRNQLVYMVRTERHRYIFHGDHPCVTWQKLLEEKDAGQTYDEQIFDLSKWTYKDFYGIEGCNP